MKDKNFNNTYEDENFHEIAIGFEALKEMTIQDVLNLEEEIRK